MKNIREEKGLTYGIYSSIHSLQQDCLLSIGADVNSENRDLVFDEIKKEILKLQLEPVSDSELQTASSHFIGSLQSDISTPFAHAEKQKTLLLKRLPAEHYQITIDTIAAMTSNDVMETAIHYFDPTSFFEVSVG
jgi:predicted Zn-dependent peptidase